MSAVPIQWSSVPDWMRQVANVLNPLVRTWPNFTTKGYIGYETGAGGTVTQATSKATGVTLGKVCGQITTAADALAAGTAVSFVLTNVQITAGDVLILNHVSGGTFGAYVLDAQCGAGAATIGIRNVTAGSLSEALVIGFALIKGATG